MSKKPEGKDGTTGKDRLAKTAQARSVVGLRQLSLLRETPFISLLVESIEMVLAQEHKNKTKKLCI